jgi:hypothetical protein
MYCSRVISNPSALLLKGRLREKSKIPHMRVRDDSRMPYHYDAIPLHMFTNIPRSRQVVCFFTACWHMACDRG